MRIETGFRLGMPVEAAWPLLIDLERVAPAMPGVKVESADEDGLRATMRVKVGPVTTSYRTHVSLEAADESARTAVLRASGREARGPGTVEALVTAKLAERAGATAVALTTELAVTGKVAQLGGSVMGEVADRLLQQFAARLEEQLAGHADDAQTRAADADGAPALAADADGAPPRAADAGGAAPPPVDLGRLAGDALRPQIKAFGAGALLMLLLVLLLRRR
jgi:carbon monoxide dehydrogenase subunit G